MHSILDQDIMYLPGVGPRKKEILSKELNIKTFGDLLEYYPYKYVDRTQIFRIAQLQGDMPYVQVKGHILSFEDRVRNVSWRTSPMGGTWPTWFGFRVQNTC